MLQYDRHHSQRLEGVEKMVGVVSLVAKWLLAVGFASHASFYCDILGFSWLPESFILNSAVG